MSTTPLKAFVPDNAELGPCTTSTLVTSSSDAPNDAHSWAPTRTLAGSRPSTRRQDPPAQGAVDTPDVHVEIEDAALRELHARDRCQKLRELSVRRLLRNHRLRDQETDTGASKSRSGRRDAP